MEKPRSIELDLRSIYALVPQEMELSMQWSNINGCGQVWMELRYNGKWEASDGWTMSDMLGYVEIVPNSTAQWLIEVRVSEMVTRAKKRLTPTFTF